jgi:hypothetical protein
MIGILTEILLLHEIKWLQQHQEVTVKTKTFVSFHLIEMKYLISFDMA